MKPTLLSALLLLSLSAASQNGSITPEMLRDIKKEQQMSPADNALRNAVATNSIDLLTQNPQTQGRLDTYFSIETPSQSIADQKQSGRCWMFSGLNVLRSDFARESDSLSVDFSHAYLFFWDQLEKSNLMLQGVIDTADKPLDDQRVQFCFKNPIGDGGTFCGVADLSEKYGLVPSEVMPETFSTDNTSRASRLIASKLREFGLQLREMAEKKKSRKSIEKAKTRMLSQIYHMLQLTIGTPPETFSYAMRDAKGRPSGPVRSWTPKEFYEATVGHSLNGTFLMVMNDPRRDYFKTYEVEYDRHTYDGHNWLYVNLPMDDIEQMAIAALKDGRKLYSSYDVAKFLDRKRGYADTENFDYGSLFSTSFSLNKAQRIATFDSGSTHAMTLCAVDLDSDGKPTKWKVENSWGSQWGQNGCLIMTDRWMREFMFRLVIPTKYAPEKVVEASKLAPTLISPEDPLFLPDE